LLDDMLESYVDWRERGSVSAAVEAGLDERLPP
jgi:hypothetical protein